MSYGCRKRWLVSESIGQPCTNKEDKLISSKMEKLDLSPERAMPSPKALLRLGAIAATPD
eukprot:scaffold36374_cov58-Attheya_sp.AAC.9